MDERAIERIQRAYPLIYHACHVQHVRRRTNEFRLSSSDAQVLAHLDRERAVSAGELAAHLGLARSTLSEAVARLERAGYVTRTPGAKDKREVRVRLAEHGAAAMRGSSVLDAERVAVVIERLSARDLARALTGLELLANAARDAVAEHEAAHPRGARGTALPGTPKPRRGKQTGAARTRPAPRKKK